MTPCRSGEQARLVRRGVGLFRAPRGLIEVRGGDQLRWLNGMISADLEALDALERTGCYALLLDPKGRILADLHVLLRDDAYWLDVEAHATAEVLARLDRYVIADDVELLDRSDHFDRLSLEGPAAPALLARAAGEPIELLPEAWLELAIDDRPVVVAAWGWSGAPGFQLLAPAGSGEQVVAALRASAGEGALVEADLEALEILRIEAGVPRLGDELDAEVFPAEARLTERAVSFTKGCYTGQEIVARLHSRGQVQHLLVGLRFAEGPPAPGTELLLEARAIGEVTSSCHSELLGPIGLGYARRAHAEPGTRLAVGEATAQVSALPFPGVLE